jgi:transposase InsO family protein
MEKDQLRIKQIISTYRSLGSINQTSIELGIDRKTVRKWIKRNYSIYSKQPLLTKLNISKSRKRKKIYYKLNSSQERRIIYIRKNITTDQKKIAYLFTKETGIKISGKTAYNIIKRRESRLILKKPKYRRPRFQNGNTMRPKNTKEPGFIQLDVKYITPELSGLSYTTYEYGFIDIYSRYKMAWILPTLDEESTITALRGIIKEAPFTIKFIQTDNGWEFSKRFHEECSKHNIEHYYNHKSSPNENAVIERSFRTDQEEFFFWKMKKPKDINDLSMQYKNYLYWYNNERPHFGINLKTPVEYLKLYYG